MIPVNYWQEKRRDRDIKRLLEGKPLAEDSDIKFTRIRTSNIFLMCWDLICVPSVRRTLWEAIWKGKPK